MTEIIIHSFAHSFIFYKLRQNAGGLLFGPVNLANTELGTLYVYKIYRITMSDLF